MVRPLDREQRAEHVLTVVALDHGSPPRSSTQLLTVSVVDVNDEAPAFPQQEYNVILRENSPPGTSLLTLKATDPDLGKTCGNELGRVEVGGATTSGVRGGKLRVREPLEGLPERLSADI